MKLQNRDIVNTESCFVQCLSFPQSDCASLSFTQSSSLFIYLFMSLNPVNSRWMSKVRPSFKNQTFCTRKANGLLPSENQSFHAKVTTNKLIQTAHFEPQIWCPHHFYSNGSTVFKISTKSNVAHFKFSSPFFLPNSLLNQVLLLNGKQQTLSLNIMINIYIDSWMIQ